MVSISSVKRRSRSTGGLVTMGTIAALVIAMTITLFGTGAANHAVASFDASSWLWSTRKGELARVNGVTGKVDTRTPISDGQGHLMQVSQSDRYVILRDQATGRISVLDLSSLTLGAAGQTTPGLGVTVALHDDTAFVVDTVQGQVRQLDPATLQPIGQTLDFPPGISGGAFDDSGRLWLLVPSEGTVVSITPAVLPTAGAATARAGAGSTGPTSSPGIPVADPSHDLALSILDNGVAVLDKTTTVLTTVIGSATRTVDLKLDGPGAMPTRTTGPSVPVTVIDDSNVYVVNGNRVSEFHAPGTNPRIQPCTAWSGRFYCPDDATGKVYVLDVDGHLTRTITVPDDGQGLQLEVREGHLFINAPATNNAAVVDDHHNARAVNKYVNNILGGDPPPVPPIIPPVKPVIGPPSAPSRVTATAGNATAHLLWGAASANGAAVLRYVVEGDGQSHQVGAGQRTFDVTGLTNGTTYTFTVYAVNRKGNGPKRAANPVVPTSEVPDAPVSVAATANPDGTVTVTWPAANGEGHKVPHYTVTAISTGDQKTFDSSGTTLVTKPGDLTYGTQYAFTVAAVNDIGASSPQSPESPSVVPFTVPDAPPGGVAVRAVTTARGAVTASWGTPASNGAPITGYRVVANGGAPRTVTGTSVRLSGFGDNTKVTVQVSAVNQAGAGKPATGSGNTLSLPTLTLGSDSGQLNGVTVDYTSTDGGGGPATCTLQISGAGRTSGGCGSAITVNGLWPGTAYSWTLTVTNKAGMSASASGSTTTPAYHGTVICDNTSYCGRGASRGGIWVYSVPAQTSGDSVGDVYHPDSYQATCHTTGDSVNATPWGGKNTNVWIRIVFPGSKQNYIPYAWFLLDSNDSYSVIPPC